MKDLNKYYNLKDLVEDCGGIENFRFFGHLDKRVGFCFAEYSDDWVECKILDDTSHGDLYTLANGYKVNIVAVDNPMYTSRLFYQSDLLSLIKDGCFILKTGDGDHVEEKEGYEHLCGSVYLHHCWSEVVKG